MRVLEEEFNYTADKNSLILALLTGKKTKTLTKVM